MFSDFHPLFQRVSASVGVFNNLILIVLIIFKSPKKLGNYKILMIYISIFEILYSILDFVSVPTIYSKHSAFLIIIDKRLTMIPDSFLQFANVSFCSLFGMSMAIFAIHFIYRFLVVTGSKHLIQNHLPKIFLLILFTLIVGCLWTAAMYRFLGPNEYSDSLLSVEYLNSRRMKLSNIDYVGAHFHQIDENGIPFINWNSMFAIILMTIVIFLSFSTVFFCGHKIYRNMQDMMSMRSSNDHNLQSQLFWALVFQTLIPVLLMHIPASFGFLFSMFNSSTEILGEVPATTILLYPALDPLPNFFIIKNYRNAILEFFGCKSASVVPADSSRQNSNTSAQMPVAITN